MQLHLATLALAAASYFMINGVQGEQCSLSPSGLGQDDTTQILAAIAKCGHNGHTTFAPGDYNITRKMTWDLDSATVDLRGTLNFVPDIDFWLQSENTYQVIFIQSQASWFVLTGKDFVVDGHGLGGIQGNGQPWWEFFTNHTREDGDGRPVSLTLSNVTRGTVNNFKVDSPPFWCNAVANSQDVVYKGMTCNSTNTNPGKHIVPNTDGIDTYRSDKVTMIDWDITCGDDCLAIKGNSTNILAKNIVCRGGNGIAFGSLGQYQQFDDIVENVLLENITTQRLDPAVQPNMMSGVYFKTWTGSVHGSPPTGGGGGGGRRVNNVVAKGVFNDRVSLPVHAFQTNSGQPGDLPSQLRYSNITFIDFTGASQSSELVDIECSSAAPCPNIAFENFAVQPPSGLAPRFVCINVINEVGLPGPCTPTGQ
ncbi:pectin lyase-like protein [Gautieria morchelliformis]|nr:pectin lyase-like protein [Gautieria morchelliformis]